MRLKSFKIGKSKEKPGRDTAEAGDTPAAQIAGLEEPVNNKAKELEATEQELKELPDTANDSEEDEGAPAQPHGPLDELSIEPEDQLQNLDEETDVGTLLGEAGEVVKVVEVGAGAVAPAEATAKAEAEKVTVAAGADDSLSNLFGDEEEEVNPLANLINALPDVTAQELVDDLREIKEIIRECQQN